MGILYFAGTLLLIGSILLDIRSMWFRKPDHPTCVTSNLFVISAVNFKPWKYRDYWDKPGYGYFVASRLLYLACLIVFTIQLIMD